MSHINIKDFDIDEYGGINSWEYRLSEDYFTFDNDELYKYYAPVGFDVSYNNKYFIMRSNLIKYNFDDIPRQLQQVYINRLFKVATLNNVIKNKKMISFYMIK